MSSLKTTLHPEERAERTISASQNDSLWRRCRSIAARINSVVTWTTFACAYVATCCCTTSAGNPRRVAATKYSCRTCVEKTAVCSLKCVARSLRAVFFFCGSSAPCAWTRTFVSKNRRSATIRLAVGDGDDPRTARRDRTCSSWEDDRED